MGWTTLIQNSNFLYKLRNWEFWPFGILQGPVFLYWLWLSLKARSLFFFSASNPGILAGGMLGESKWEVLRKVPVELTPKTILMRLPTDKDRVLATLEQLDRAFPVIFKPDIGERGWMVRKIQSAADVESYLKEIRVDFIIQEFVDLPLEFGVAYYRFPTAENGIVNSIVAKEFLSVTGDGKRSLADLIMDKPRARLHRRTLNDRYRAEWNTILPSGKTKELVPIGNHALGTRFFDARNLITPRLTAAFDKISKRVDGFFFGRYDLRCASISDLENGNVRIVELNGCGAEPAHIYHTGYSFWRAMGDLLTHVRIMYEISVANHKRGVPYLSFREGRAIYRRFKALRYGN
jgi:hypothetical protein